MRHHRPISAGSDTFKDLAAQIATTPPSRPSLERVARQGSSSTTTYTTYSTTTVESHHTHTASAAYTKHTTDTTTETFSSVSAGSSVETRVTGSVSTTIISSSEHFEEGKPPLSEAARRQLSTGTLMLKVSAKKQHSRLFKLDLENGKIHWDSRKFGRINVEQIKELRKGKAARMYREQLQVKNEHEDRWLTIIYFAAGKYKTLHLVAPTKDKYEDWITAVEYMWNMKREATEGLPHMQRKTDQWLKEHWMDADNNVDSKLGYEEIVRLCHRLNINFSRKEIRMRFEQADGGKQGHLDFNDFTQFVKLLKERKDVVELFGTLAKSDSMTIEEFTDFMIRTQKSNLDEDQIKEVYGKHVDKILEQFTVDSLTSFLLSVDNPIVSPIHAQVHQDMSQTLSNYYISSSHNTYLLGHQLTGESSIEGYIRALQSGCRCVELDCWDGPDGQPIIYHGRTLTSKILFRDVIEAISTYAFVTTPYPLILSLELHCDLDQQEVMANIMREKLKSWILIEPLETSGHNLPSPDQLRNKILIKSKVLPPDTTSQEYSTATDTESESEREGESDSESVKHQKSKGKTKKVRVARALSDMTVYCQSRHFPGFSHEGCSPCKIVSFSERASLSKTKQLQEYINWNKTHMTRIYPAGFRINSNNYDPHHHWAAGAQVVALNYQSYDRGMQMNNAMFTMNGRCGYVLKPTPLALGRGQICDHSKAPNFLKTHPVDVTIEIISAQQLPRPNESLSGEVSDPVCEIEVLIPGESAIKYKTRHVNDNGFNPRWHNEKFHFSVNYEHHELVFIRFVIQDEDIKFSELIASYCISLDCLQEGYRHIQLLDACGDPYLYSTVFIKVTIEPVSAGALRTVEAVVAPALTAIQPSLPPSEQAECDAVSEVSPHPLPVSFL